MKKERILALSVAKLGLSIQAQNHLVRLVMQRKEDDIALLRGKAYSRRIKELAHQITVQEVINFWEAEKREPKTHVRYEHGLIARFIKKLAQLGLTQLDWIALPSSTVTTKMLRRLGKEKLRSLSISVLNTLSSEAMKEIARRAEKQTVQDTTIHDLLNTQLFGMGRWSDDSFSRNFARSFQNTRTKLHELGFHYKDGPFLQYGTQRKLAEDLMKAESLSKRMANKFAKIARKRGMVSEFIE